MLAQEQKVRRSMLAHGHEAVRLMLPRRHEVGISTLLAENGLRSLRLSPVGALEASSQRDVVYPAPLYLELTRSHVQVPCLSLPSALRLMYDPSSRTSWLVARLRRYRDFFMRVQAPVGRHEGGREYANTVGAGGQHGSVKYAVLI